MLSFLNEDFYHQLSRRELRDLLWATESSATSPNAILIAVVEKPGTGKFSIPKLELFIGISSSCMIELLSVIGAVGGIFKTLIEL